MKEFKRYSYYRTTGGVYVVEEGIVNIIYGKEVVFSNRLCIVEFENEAKRVSEKLNELNKENHRLSLQLSRLYNYFEDYCSEEISSNNFSEMWDNVKRDEKWDN